MSFVIKMGKKFNRFFEHDKNEEIHLVRSLSRDRFNVFRSSFFNAPLPRALSGEKKTRGFPGAREGEINLPTPECWGPVALSSRQQ